MKKSIKIAIVMFITLLFISNIVYAEERINGDINGDGKFTVTDISILKLHLANVKIISDENLNYADVNEDGKITVTDLSKIKIMIVEKIEIVGEELDINSEEIKKLYDYIPILDDMRIENFADAYTLNLTKITNIDNKLILNMGLINMPSSQDSSSIAALTDGLNLFSFSSEKLDNSIKRIFGDDVNVKHETFNTQKAFLDMSCKYDENSSAYTCTWTGLSNGYVNEIRNLNTAIKENEQIYLFDKYIYTEITQGENNVTIIKIYSNSEKNNLLKTIETEKDFTDEELYEMLEELMQMYKHTFKQASDGRYYWYATELVS